MQKLTSRPSIPQPNGAQPQPHVENGHVNGTASDPRTAFNRSTVAEPEYSPDEFAVVRAIIAHPAFAKQVLAKVEIGDFQSRPISNIVAAARYCAQNKITPTLDQIEEGLRIEAEKASDKDTRRDLRKSQAIVAEIQSKPCTPEILRQARDYIKQLEATARQALEITPPAFAFSTDLDLDSRLSEISWLWDRYIPNGFLTGLVGEQDQGKSMVAQGLCNTIISGGRWPDGTHAAFPDDTKLLWIDTEGSIALFHQRAKDWKMPRGRFILPPDPLQELTVDDAVCWHWIEAAIEHFHPPLVVIDALSGAHRTGKISGNDEMKPIMKQLASLAQKHNIAVLVIHHLNKPAPGVPSYPITIHRLLGAQAIPQYCRSILAIGTPDPAQPDARRLDVIKLNLAKKPEPVGYEITDLGPAWGAAPEPPKERRAVDDAVDFLEIALAGGPRPSEEIEGERKAAGIGSNAIKDAKKILGVQAKREGGKEGGRWFLVPKETYTVARESEGDANQPRVRTSSISLSSLSPLTPLTPLDHEEVKPVEEVTGLMGLAPCQSTEPLETVRGEI